MKTKIKVLYNTGVQIVGRFFNSAVTYLITLMLVRKYGAEGFGDFVKIITYISYFYIMADFGANAITVKRISENEKESSKFISELLGFRIVSSAILVLISIIILVFLPQGIDQGFTSTVRLGIILGVATIFTQSILTTTNAFFQKNMRYDKSVFAAGVGYLVILLLAYLFTASSLPIGLLSLIYVAGQIISVMIAFLLLNEKIIPDFNPAKLKNIFTASLPLGLTLILNLVYFKADSFILTLTRSTAEVGIYGLAYKFFELTLVLPTFFMNSLYPVMLKNLNMQGDGFNSLMKKSGLFLVASSLLITVGIFWSAPNLISLTTGAKFYDFNGAVQALRILSLGLPFFFLSSFLMWMLITRNKQNIMAVFYGISMLLNVVLNIFFIPRYGYTAAAIITVVSEVFVVLLLLIPNIKANNN